jgi:hypothetical protein
MQSSLQTNGLLASLLLLSLLTVSAHTARSAEAGPTLMEHYDDGSEMTQRIILEFLTSPLCQHQCDQLDKNSLLNTFEQFRVEWVDKMITYVINELGLDAESARYVRKNPANYKINYETFKLLDFK